MTTSVSKISIFHIQKFSFNILEIRKVLGKIAALKDCNEVASWIKPCVNHLHWSARTTPSGDGNLIWAKFKSFLSHIRDKHSGLDEPLFNECAHAEITDRDWLDKGNNKTFGFPILFTVNLN